MEFYNLYLNSNIASNVFSLVNNGQMIFNVDWNTVLPSKYQFYRVSVSFMANQGSGSTFTNQLYLGFDTTNITHYNTVSSGIPILHIYPDPSVVCCVSRRNVTSEFTIKRPIRNNLYFELRNTAEGGIQAAAGPFCLFLQFRPCITVFDPPQRLPYQNYTLVLKSIVSSNIIQTNLNGTTWRVDWRFLPSHVKKWNVFSRFISGIFANTGGFGSLMLSLDIGNANEQIQNASLGQSTIIGIINTSINSGATQAFYNGGNEQISPFTMDKPTRDVVSLQFLNPVNNQLSSVQVGQYALYLTFEPIMEIE